MLLALLGGVASSQSNRASSRGGDEIKRLLANAGISSIGQTPAGPSVEVRIRWNAYVSARPQVDPDTAQRTPGGGFVVTEVRPIPESVVLPRSPELSSNQLLVAAVDKDQHLRGWALVNDPRLLRAEEPGPSGELKGRLLHHTKPEFVVGMPNDPAIFKLIFYHPVWSGQTFSLQALGEASFQGKGR